MKENITLTEEELCGMGGEQILTHKLPTPRTKTAASTTLDHTICLEDLPSPPRIPPSRAEGVASRVDQFNKWSDISHSLAADSYLQDTARSPLRRSALRDISQDNYQTRKRKLKKQVSFAEHNDSTFHSITSPKKGASSPPPYEHIAGFITNKPSSSTKTFTGEHGTRLRSNMFSGDNCTYTSITDISTDTFYDAASTSFTLR